MVDRVLITPSAADLIERLRGTHGRPLFHQSGGCCDGSAPMCFPETSSASAIRTCGSAKSRAARSTSGGAQFEYWQHTQLIVDV